MIDSINKLILDSINIFNNKSLNSKKLFCIWKSELEENSVPHIFYFEDIVKHLNNCIMKDIYPSTQFDAFLGIGKYDNINKDNYNEIYKLYRFVGIEINENTIDISKNEHPIIQVAKSKKIEISPELYKILNVNIQCFYLKEFDENIKNNKYYKQLIEKLFQK